MFDQFHDVKEKADKGNAFAKSAVEMALIDAVARMLGLPAWQLLGGRRHDSLPLAWTLASGDVARDIEEAQLRLQQHRHRLPEDSVAMLVDRLVRNATRLRDLLDDLLDIDRLARGTLVSELIVGASTWAAGTGRVDSLYRAHRSQGRPR